MVCRFCSKTIDHKFADLGNTAISNAFVNEDQLNEAELIYPLRVFVCDNCFLVQVEEYKKSEDIFSSDYVYFSSVSNSWLQHSKRYVEMIIPKFGLNEQSLVTEIASNDGYLLQYFKQRNIPCIGIEPTNSTAQIAIKKEIETLTEFFDEKLAKKLAKEGKKSDLIIGNNVLAHVPGLNDFVRGLKIILKPRGIMTFEFPHLMKLIENGQFDTIYHEHFSYFSFYFVCKLFRFHGFEIFDVEQLDTHGGSLRIYIKHKENETIPLERSTRELFKAELEAGVKKLSFYEGFHNKIDEIKNKFLVYILSEKIKGKKIIGFGAAAKGNTFFNYAGLKDDTIECIVDDTPFKQGRYTPQSHIPVVSREYFKNNHPDIIIIIPWNFKCEIKEKLQFTKEWGAKFVTYIPTLEVN